MAFVVPKERSFLTEAAVMNYVAKQVTILAALITFTDNVILAFVVFDSLANFDAGCTI